MMLTGQILIPLPTSAMEIDEEGNEYWYVQENIEYWQEAKNIIAERCAAETARPDCIVMEREGLINELGNRYQAAYQQMHNYRSIGTAVNPYRNTIRLLYNGIDPWANADDARLEELYLYWLEDGLQAPNFDDVFYEIYREEIKNNTPEEGIHVVYSGERNGDEHWLETGIETRLVLEPGILTGNTNGKIFYSGVSNYGNQINGVINYESCLYSEGFSEGMECRAAIVLTPYNSYSYLLMPFAETVEDTNLQSSPLTTILEPEPIPEPEPTPAPGSTPVPEVRSWGINDLLELNKVVDAEIELTCGMDFDCRWRLRDFHFMTDPELYEAMDIVTTPHFLITAVNPEAGQVKALYRSLTAHEKLFGDAPRSLHKIKIFWSETIYDDPYAELLDLSTQNVHLIANWDFDSIGADVSEQEILYSSDSFTVDPNKRLYYDITYGDGEREIWYIDYGAYLDEAIESAEYRLTLNAYGELYYTPQAATGTATSIETFLPIPSTPTVPVLLAEDDPKPDEAPESNATMVIDTDTELDCVTGGDIISDPEPAREPSDHIAITVEEIPLGLEDNYEPAEVILVDSSETIADQLSDMEALADDAKSAEPPVSDGVEPLELSVTEGAESAKLIISSPKAPDTGEPSSELETTPQCCSQILGAFAILYLIWWLLPVGKKHRQ